MESQDNINGAFRIERIEGRSMFLNPVTGKQQPFHSVEQMNSYIILSLADELSKRKTEAHQTQDAIRHLTRILRAQVASSIGGDPMLDGTLARLLVLEDKMDGKASSPEIAARVVDALTKTGEAPEEAGDTIKTRWPYTEVKAEITVANIREYVNRYKRQLDSVGSYYYPTAFEQDTIQDAITGYIDELVGGPRFKAAKPEDLSPGAAGASIDMIITDEIDEKSEEQMKREAHVGLVRWFMEPLTGSDKKSSVMLDPGKTLSGDPLLEAMADEIEKGEKQAEEFLRSQGSFGPKGDVKDAKPLPGIEDIPIRPGYPMRESANLLEITSPFSAANLRASKDRIAQAVAETPKWVEDAKRMDQSVKGERAARERDATFWTAPSAGNVKALIVEETEEIKRKLQERAKTAQDPKPAINMISLDGSPWDSLPTVRIGNARNCLNTYRPRSTGHFVIGGEVVDSDQSYLYVAGKDCHVQVVIGTEGMSLFAKTSAKDDGLYLVAMDRETEYSTLSLVPKGWFEEHFEIYQQPEPQEPAKTEEEASLEALGLEAKDRIIIARKSQAGGDAVLADPAHYSGFMPLWHADVFGDPRKRIRFHASRVNAISVYGDYVKLGLETRFKGENAVLHVPGDHIEMINRKVGKLQFGHVIFGMDGEIQFISHNQWVHQNPTRERVPKS